jgi:GNAT superfamily N-acetyltransferase
VRRAVPGDEHEIIRLRNEMRKAVWPDSSVDDGYDGLAASVVLGWLRAGAEARTAAFVLDAPDGSGGLAASVIGAVDERLPSARNPSGRSGYVYGVSTDPRFRRLGYSRLAMTALLDWYEELGITRIELHASEFGEGLYRELGFAEPGGVAMTRNVVPVAAK